MSWYLVFSLLVASPAGKDMDGVKRFRCLLSSETDRLKVLCSSWKEMLVADAEQLNEEGEMYLCTTSVLIYHFGVCRFILVLFVFSIIHSPVVYIIHFSMILWLSE